MLHLFVIIWRRFPMCLSLLNVDDGGISSDEILKITLES